jgi:hypothetical protein
MEAGYIYPQQTAEHSTTLAGISDFQVIYSDEKDLEQQYRRL